MSARPPPRIYVLAGVNGAGKSSTLRCVSRILKSRAGSLRFEGRDLLVAGRGGAHGVNLR